MKLHLKKPVKILLIIAGSLFGLFLLIAILVSPIAHHYLEKHSKELCNRVVTMDKLCVNLFTVPSPSKASKPWKRTTRMSCSLSTN